MAKKKRKSFEETIRKDDEPEKRELKKGHAWGNWLDLEPKNKTSMDVLEEEIPYLAGYFKKAYGATPTTLTVSGKNFQESDFEKLGMEFCGMQVIVAQKNCPKNTVWIDANKNETKDDTHGKK